MMKIFSIEELEDLCLKWQERLGLSHWQIDVKIRQEIEDTPLLEMQGENQMSLSMEQAMITVLDTFYCRRMPFKKDMEVSLVHELLHIPVKYFANPEAGTLEHIHLEAFLERTAKLLVSLARECERTGGPYVEEA